MRKFFLPVVLCFLPAALFSQSAREETITLYDTMSGDIFYNETFFVNETNSPVQISSVEARHIPSDTAELAEQIVRSLGRYEHLATQMDRVREYTQANLRITISAEGSDVVAVKFAVIAYDAFGEHLGGLTAITMDPPQSGMVWDFSPAYLFKFKRYGVVGVYVQQARLANGEIWDFDSETVLDQFQEFRAEITMEQISSDGNFD